MKKIKITIEQDLLDGIQNGQISVEDAVDDIFGQVYDFNDNVAFVDEIDIEDSRKAMTELLTSYRDGDVPTKSIRKEITGIVNTANLTTNSIHKRTNIQSRLLNNLVDEKISLDEATVQVCSNVRGYSKRDVRNPVKVYIDDNYLYVRDLLSKYKDGDITEDELRKKLYNMVKDAQEESKHHYEVRKNASESLNLLDDAVLNYSEEDITAITTNCSHINDSILEIDVAIPGPMAKYASTVEAILENKTSIGEDMYYFALAFYQALRQGEECDFYSDNGEITYEKIKAILSSINNNNSKAIPIDETFFENCEKDEYGRPMLEIDGKKCAYDLENQVFYVDGKPAFQTGDTISSTQIFVPSNATDYSTLNTFTFFAGTQASSRAKGAPACNELITKGYDKNGYQGKNTNAILIQTDKFTGNNSWSETPGCYENTALLTKFVNKVAGTQEGCRNIIGGDSVYGAHAVKIAARSEGLYQTVYCINNAVIVPNRNGDEKETGGDKEKTTEEDLVKLEKIAQESGMDIYFINTAGDGNLNHNTAHPSFNDKRGCAFDESYTYTGIQILCEECPSVNAHMMYIPYGILENGKLVTNIKPAQVYKTLANPETGEEFANYYYEENWFEAVNGPYNTHTDGNLAIADIVDFYVTSENDFYTY